MEWRSGTRNGTCCFRATGCIVGVSHVPTAHIRMAMIAIPFSRCPWAARWAPASALDLLSCPPLIAPSLFGVRSSVLRRPSLWPRIRPPLAFYFYFLAGCPVIPSSRSFLTLQIDLLSRSRSPSSTRVRNSSSYSFILCFSQNLQPLTLLCIAQFLLAHVLIAGQYFFSVALCPEL